MGIKQAVKEDTNFLAVNQKGGSDKSAESLRERFRSAARDREVDGVEVLGHPIAAWIVVATRPDSCGQVAAVLSHALLADQLPDELTELQMHLLRGLAEWDAGRSTGRSKKGQCVL